MEKLGIISIIAALTALFFVYEPKARGYVLGGASVGAGMLLSYVISTGAASTGRSHLPTEQNQRFSRVPVKEIERLYNEVD